MRGGRCQRLTDGGRRGHSLRSGLCRDRRGHVLLDIDNLDLGLGCRNRSLCNVFGDLYLDRRCGPLFFDGLY